MPPCSQRDSWQDLMAADLSLGLCSQRELQTDWLGKIRRLKTPAIYAEAIGIPTPISF